MQNFQSYYMMFFIPRLCRVEEFTIILPRRDLLYIIKRLTNSKTKYAMTIIIIEKTSFDPESPFC